MKTTEILLATLRQAKAEFPQLRIAQIIVNAAGGDPFYCEDDTLNSMILQWLERARRELRGAGRTP